VSTTPPVKAWESIEKFIGSEELFIQMIGILDITVDRSSKEGIRKCKAK
jgi:hypothetical protein